MRLHKPWPANRRITSPFGYRIHPISKRRALHRGVDVAGRFPVTAAEEGIVAHIGWNPTGGGHVVIIKHGAKLYTVYYHGRTRTPLNKNQRVQPGDFIYESGSTGASTGDHLHFEVRTSRFWGTQVDPEPFLHGGVENAINTQTGLKVNGRLDAPTRRRWQEVLKQQGHAIGLIDGVIGPRTTRAIQTVVGVTVTGSMNPETRRGVQRHLGVRQDGVWGPITISALQRRLNEGKF
jgi:murein DD-endopeptidase MepM/ murein hydrolase activator NlpD